MALPLHRAALVKLMHALRLLLLLALTVAVGGCEVIGGIFKAGMFTGVLIVVVILVVIFFIAGKFRR